MLINDIAKEIAEASTSERTKVVNQSIVRLIDAHSTNIPSALADAQMIENEIGSVGSPSAAFFWRDLAVPGLLQEAAGFSDDTLIVAATSPSAATSTEWVAGEAWVKHWVKVCLDIDRTNFKQGFLLPYEGQLPVADHPLILRVARPFFYDMLDQPAGAAKVLVFTQWVAQRALTNPDKAMTAGDLVIALAEHQQVSVNKDGTLDSEGGPESEPWRDLAEHFLDGLVKLCEEGDEVPDDWRNRSERIAKLLNACPPWREGDRRFHIQRRAQRRLRSALVALDTEMQNAMEAIPEDLGIVDLAMDTIETKIPFSNPFWQGNIQQKNHIRKLNEASGQILDESTNRIPLIRGAATKLLQMQQNFVDRSHSPIVRTEVFRAMAPHVILRHGGTLAFMQQQAAKLPEIRLLETLTDPETWQTQTQNRIPVASEAMHTKAWRVLEAWDGLRGSALAGDAAGVQTVAALRQQLPGWLVGDDDLPSNDDAPISETDDPWKELRPVLAAISLLGLPPAADGRSDKLHENLRKHLYSIDTSDQTTPPSLYSLLFATRIDQALTRLASGEENLADALGLKKPDSANIDKESLVRFSLRSTIAMNSPFSWESRAGFNGLILLCRLAETTGSIFAAKALSDALVKSSRANHLIAAALTRLRTGEESVGHSDLPLTLVAFDLARAHRETAESIHVNIGTDFAAEHPWLEHFNSTINGQNFSPSGLIDDLVSKLTKKNTATADAFMNNTRLSGRTLLLCLFEAKLGAFQQQLQLRINALKPKDGGLVQLKEIRDSVRRIFCTERILLADQDRLARLEKGFAPWWRIAFWSGEEELLADPSEQKERVSEGFVSWLPAFNGEPEARLLAWAAELESAVPIPRVNSDRDIDGRSEFALPRLTWGKAMDNLDGAWKALQSTETEYDTALTGDIEREQQQELTTLFQQQLRLDTADFEEQANVAIAEVRAAEAGLEAAKHLSLAAELETFAAGFIYDAAKLETERNILLKKVADKQVELERLNTDIEAIVGDNAELSTLSAALQIEVRQKMQECAQISLDMARNAHDALNKRIELLESLLEKELLSDAGKKVVGKIGLMGAQISDTLTVKLAADLEDAEKDLNKEEAKERARKKLERENRLVNATLRFVGAVTGFVLGGPAGATLGAEIGGTLAELREGSLANKPPEEILMGLVDNGLAIAEASGLDLKGELNSLGKKGAQKADAFFVELEKELGPIFETMPTVLEEQVFKDALMVLGLDEDIPDFIEGVEKTYAALKKDVDELQGMEGLGDVLLGPGGGEVLNFKDPKTLRNHIRDNLFDDTTGEHGKLKKVAVKFGSNIEKLKTPEGRFEARERLANLVVTKVSQEAMRYRDEKVRKWSQGKLKDGKLWKDETVQKEAKPLLEALYPNKKDREELEKGLDRMLGGDNKLFGGEIEKWLAPWQGELDRKIGEISKFCNEKVTKTPPTTSFAAAKARVAYIEAFQNEFLFGKNFPPGKKTLATWLEGDSQERRDLFVKLRKLEEDAKESLGKLEQANIDLEIQDIQIDQARITYDKAMKEVEIAGINQIKADLEVDKATLMARVSELSGLKAGKEEEASGASADARKAEQAAAEQNVIGAEANLIAAESRAQGTRRRGSVARRIRSSLSLPVLSFSTAGPAALAREKHAEALGEAFRALRELQRHTWAADIELRSDLVDPSPIRADGGHITWSIAIDDYLKKIKKELIEEDTSRFRPNSGRRLIPTFKQILNDVHIKQLFGKGLTLFLGPIPTNDKNQGRIEEQVKDDQAASGRILAIIVCGQFEGGSLFNDSSIVSIHATHLGDRWLGPSKVYLTDRQKMNKDRLYVTGPIDPLHHDENDRIEEWVNNRGMTRKFTIGGDPHFETHEGVSLSGTIVLRLKKRTDAPKIVKLSLVIPYVYYASESL